VGFPFLFGSEVLQVVGNLSARMKHEFVIMPNHLHLLLTPAAEIPLEKALQFIKGGFSYRAKREIHFALKYGKQVS
jgi:hypothetical protein